MPAGSLGFLASGKLTRDEYHQMLEPILEVLDRGQPVTSCSPPPTTSPASTWAPSGRT
jgi:hypothetical protein